jgi:NarL family two-component system response regulator YdfI
MREKNGTIRLVVADDHPVVREGLRMMLEASGEDFALVGDAADGASVLQVVEESQPDVVLMDIRMPGMDGLEALEHLREHWPQIAVIILTTYNEDELLIRGLRAGARGYLLKDTNRETLFQAIRVAARGEMLVQPDVMARVLSHTLALDSPPQFTRSGGLELTEREREILAAIVRGERSKEIARHLGITESTVKAHLTNIYTKLNVDSRASAVAAAFERGLLSSSDGSS